MSVRSTITRTLHWAALMLAMRKPAPNRIPLAGDLSSRNYFTVNLGDDHDPWMFAVTQIDDHGVVGLWFSPDQEPARAAIPYSALADYRLLIRLFLREVEIQYRSPVEFLFHQATFLPWALVLRHRITQALFKRQRLVRGQRMEVLRLLVEKTLEHRDYLASATDIMTHLYGTRWTQHPESLDLHRYYVTVLESLVWTGDLSAVDHSYRLEPHALVTLSHYEEDERQHRDQLRQQKIVGVLTLALTVVGLIQAAAIWYK